jgi:hypothetical protein
MDFLRRTLKAGVGASNSLILDEFEKQFDALLKIKDKYDKNYMKSKSIINKLLKKESKNINAKQLVLNKYFDLINNLLFNFETEIFSKPSHNKWYFVNLYDNYDEFVSLEEQSSEDKSSEIRRAHNLVVALLSQFTGKPIHYKSKDFLSISFPPRDERTTVSTENRMKHLREGISKFKDEKGRNYASLIEKAKNMSKGMKNLTEKMKARNQREFVGLPTKNKWVDPFANATVTARKDPFTNSSLAQWNAFANNSPSTPPKRNWDPFANNSPSTLPKRNNWDPFANVETSKKVKGGSQTRKNRTRRA